VKKNRILLFLFLAVGFMIVGLTTNAIAETTKQDVNENVTATAQTHRNGIATYPAMVAIGENVADPNDMGGDGLVVVMTTEAVSKKKVDLTVARRRIVLAATVACSTINGHIHDAITATTALEATANVLNSANALDIAIRGSPSALTNNCMKSLAINLDRRRIRTSSERRLGMVRGLDIGSIFADFGADTG